MQNFWKLLLRYSTLYSMLSCNLLAQQHSAWKQSQDRVPKHCKAPWLLQCSSWLLGDVRRKHCKELQRIAKHHLRTRTRLLSGYAGYLLGSAVLNGLAGNRTTAGVWEEGEKAMPNHVKPCQTLSRVWVESRMLPERIEESSPYFFMLCDNF